MLGRKKKDEQSAATEENALDKPQTLAELDAMAREKKDDKVMLQDGDGEQVADHGALEHEVVHNDEHTVDTNVKQVTGSQRRLQGLVGIAVIFLITGGVLFYSQIEDGNVGVGAGGSEVIASGSNDGEVSDLLPRGTYAYAASSGGSSYKRFNLENNEAADIDIGGSVSTSQNSPSFQLSSNSLVSAAQTGSGIVIRNIEEVNTILADQVANIREWILLPDGTQVVALIGNNLHTYDTTNGQGGVVAENFIPAGADLSALNYSRDGSVNIYAKTGGDLAGSIYDLETGEVTALEKTVTRLERMGGFSRNSISPDGISMVFIANINGNQTLQLLSLNSFVLRTIYLAESGNTPAQFAWSDNSNSIIIYEAGSSPLISQLKVGTLEKEILLENTEIAGGLSWSPDKTRASFIQSGTLKAVTIDSKEVTDLIDGVADDAITGWFQN